MSGDQDKKIEAAPEAPKEEPKAPPTNPIELLEQEYGVRKGSIAKWKSLYGIVEVMMIHDKPYIYRGLNRMEWNGIQNSLAGKPPFLLEEAVTSAVLLHPVFDPAEPCSAGVPAVIYIAATRLSKFDSDGPPQRL